jgi:hypothetical protein
VRVRLAAAQTEVAALALLAAQVLALVFWVAAEAVEEAVAAE